MERYCGPRGQILVGERGRGCSCRMQLLDLNLLFGQPPVFFVAIMVLMKVTINDRNVNHFHYYERYQLSLSSSLAVVVVAV